MKKKSILFLALVVIIFTNNCSPKKNLPSPFWALALLGGTGSGISTGASAGTTTSSGP